jgi:GNAT superfamily N-acetyltransferase
VRRVFVTHANSKDGIEIVGVLHVQSSGVFIIAVRHDHRRQGIGTALLKAAEESASIKPDLGKTTFGSDGEAFIKKLLPDQPSEKRSRCP